LAEILVFIVAEPSRLDSVGRAIKNIAGGQRGCKRNGRV